MNKGAEFTKEELQNLKNSFLWIDQNHFATLDMLPIELAKFWVDYTFESRNQEGVFQRVIFLYGLLKTQELLKKNDEKFDLEILDLFYAKWQVKIHLSLNQQIKDGASPLPLDRIPLFIFTKTVDQEVQTLWKKSSLMISDLGLHFSII